MPLATKPKQVLGNAGLGIRMPCQNTSLQGEAAVA